MKKTTILSGLMLSAITLTACSDETFDGDAPKNWAGTIDFFVPTEDATFQTYYKPELGRIGDTMPFYDEKAGEFKVLYLQEFNNNDSYCYHPFYALSTKDGANYQNLGEILPTGKSRYEADAALGTGCAVYNEADGLYYIYYTGQTAYQVVMRATSPDFKTWTKDREWMLKGSDFGYSDKDFRDPQIFKGDDGKWHMVISSDLKFVEFVSDNMKDWQHAGNFPMIWDRMCECPDIFKMGNYWYLVYSEGYRAEWSRKVKYMMSETWEGLKKCFTDPGRWWPKDGKEGVLDSRAFYAGKTASNGTDRYIWGWSPYRSGENIFAMNTNVGASSEPNWSGALVCHKVKQHEDGTLTLAEVPAIRAKYNTPAQVNVVMSNGTQDNKTLKGDDAYIQFNRLGAHNHISFTVTTGGNWDKFGVSFVQAHKTVLNPNDYLNEEGKPDVNAIPESVKAKIQRSYTIVCNPENENVRKFNFEEEGFFKFGDVTHNVGKGFIPGIDGYSFDRPSDNTYKFDIYTDNSVLVMYVNDNVCYTQRIYGMQKNCWAINNYGGSITVSDLKVSQY